MPRGIGFEDLQRVKCELDAELRKAGYLTIAEDKTDPASPAFTARKGSQWLRWTASIEDGGALTRSPARRAPARNSRPKPAGSRGSRALKQCEVVECTSKAEDSVAMRTAQKEETSLTGNVRTLTLACPSTSAAQALSAVEGELKASGFEILFSDREHPESGWMTGRAGKKWVELVSRPGRRIGLLRADCGSVGGSVDGGETRAVACSGCSASTGVQIAAQPAPPPEPVPVPAARTSALRPSDPHRCRTPVVAGSGFVPPKPILQVPIEATHDRIYSVSGDVVINMLVDIDENGSVTKAVLTGRITKDVLKLRARL